MIYLLYLDPGNGSYLAQVIIASILKVVFYFRNLLYVIRNFFYRMLGKKDRSADS